MADEGKRSRNKIVYNKIFKKFSVTKNEAYEQFYKNQQRKCKVIHSEDGCSGKWNLFRTCKQKTVQDGGHQPRAYIAFVAICNE